VLGKHEVVYHECPQCESLQTDPPFWLDEAYSKGHLGSADTGAVARCLTNQSSIFELARALRFSCTARILDFGGGNGLLCRLLRDLDFDARRFDSHAANHFAQNFEDDGGTYDIVCAFEVVEHFANPFKELPTIFEGAERAVVIGTQPYARQGKSWWYGI
jgi:2-polyprenyl-3-methyl-5-hydroxy-6-metoxy-1,4-benzoquinol methylase